MKEPMGFASAKSRAGSLAEDTSRVSSLLAKAIAKARRNRGRLERVWDDLTSLFRLVRAWATGRYREIPWRSLVLAIAAIVYFVNPLDVITDFLPFFGFVDDAAAIGFVVASIKEDIAKFRSWSEREHAAVKID